jgi:hypothetical protein
MKVLHCDLMLVNEIYPFQKVLQNCFKSVLKFHSTQDALIIVILSLMIIITLHNIFRIFLCVNNTKKVVI